MDDIQDPQKGVDSNSVKPPVCIIQSLLNPLRVAKILIQLGYEPLPPTISKRPFFFVGYSSPTMAFFPNAFSYTHHLLQTQGIWRVLSCGFMSNLCFDALTETCELFGHQYCVEKILCSNKWLDDEEIVFWKNHP